MSLVLIAVRVAHRARPLLSSIKTRFMNTRRNLKYRYLKTKMALSETINAILDINRKRRFYKDDLTGKQQLEEELKVLNAVAENQARILRTYERQLPIEESIPAPHATAPRMGPAIS